jgi:hypothetical protein
LPSFFIPSSCNIAYLLFEERVGLAMSDKLPSYLTESPPRATETDLCVRGAVDARAASGSWFGNISSFLTNTLW